nr:DUF1294 domain-containing protein [Clostridia bacterium]
MAELFIKFAVILLGVWLVGINISGFLIAAYDKHISKKPRGSVMRVPEKAFVRISALGGGIGTLFAMFLLHHKTKSHNILLVKISLFTAVWAILILLALKYA